MCLIARTGLKFVNKFQVSSKPGPVTGKPQGDLSQKFSRVGPTPVQNFTGPGCTKRVKNGYKTY